jgi:hypothetical protein
MELDAPLGQETLHPPLGLAETQPCCPQGLVQVALRTAEVLQRRQLFADTSRNGRLPPQSAHALLALHAPAQPIVSSAEAAATFGADKPLPRQRAVILRGERQKPQHAKLPASRSRGYDWVHRLSSLRSARRRLLSCRYCLMSGTSLAPTSPSGCPVAWRAIQALSREASA